MINLPLELVNKILYEFDGLCHKNSQLIKLQKTKLEKKIFYSEDKNFSTNYFFKKKLKIICKEIKKIIY